MVNAALLLKSLPTPVIDHLLSGPTLGPTMVAFHAMRIKKPLATCLSLTAGKGPNRSKQCHCVQVAQRIIILHKQIKALNLQ